MEDSLEAATFANGDHDGSAGKTETDVAVKNDQIEQKLGDTKDVKAASKVDEKNGSGSEISEPDKVKDDEEDTKNKETPQDQEKNQQPQDQDQEKNQQMPPMLMLTMPVNDNDNKINKPEAEDEEPVGLKRDASVVDDVDVISPTAEKTQEAQTEIALSPSDPKKQRLAQSEMTEETRQEPNTRDVEDGTEAEDRPEEIGDEQEEEADEQEQEVDDAPATPQSSKPVPVPKKTSPKPKAKDAKNNDKNEKAKAKAKKEKKEQQPTPKKKHEKKESKSKDKEPTQKRTKNEGKGDDTEAKKAKRKSKADDETQALRKASLGTRSGTVTVILAFPFEGWKNIGECEWLTKPFFSSHNLYYFIFL